PYVQTDLTPPLNPTHRHSPGGSTHAETRPHPRTDVLEEKPLVCGKPLRIETRRILVQPPSLVGDAVRTDDHGRRRVRGFKKPTPLRDHLTVTSEHDRLRRIGRNVNGDLATTVVAENLGDKFTRDRVDPRRFWRREFVHVFTPRRRR